jgi:two-component system chemotaxis response regulator CheB
MPGSKIKVLIGDSSRFSRLVMSDILNSDPGIEVIDTASSGDELLDKTRRLKPDVIYLDSAMVRNERFFSLKRMVSECDTPLVLSGSDERADEKVMSEARISGVAEVIVKPPHTLQPELRSISAEIINKVKSAARHKPVEIKASIVKRVERPRLSEPTHVVVIGSSTGGPQAVEAIIRNLRSTYTGAVLIAQHMPGGFTKSFAERLNAISELPVEEAEHGMLVEGGKVIVAKGDTNMIITSLMGIRNKFRVEFVNETSSYDRPSIDLLMQSAAAAFGRNAIGVILSGMGNDGTMGVKAICEHGGFTLAQDKDSCVVFGMGRSAVEHGYIHKVLPITDIANYVAKGVAYHTTGIVE